VTEDANGPLAGIRVLELGQIAAGPFAGSLLADLGADVVKVERPDGGDGMRSWPPLTQGQDGEVFSENFASLNRNKRSIALNLKDAGDVERLKRLISVADVLVENYATRTCRRSTRASSIARFQAMAKPDPMPPRAPLT
jgi:crotonobetainyl-CoA:carnitine CoA-transferase CaiB-like acyl-CoA transferase